MVPDGRPRTVSDTRIGGDEKKAARKGGFGKSTEASKQRQIEICPTSGKPDMISS
jgi:hypothetical protein